MCSADSLSALHLCYFVGKILYPKKKYELDILLSCFLEIKLLLSDCNFTIVSFQDSVLRLLFKNYTKVNYTNETLFVNCNCLTSLQNKWSVLQFQCQSKTFKRIFKVVPSSKIPKGYILCSSDTFYVIKHSFQLSPYVVHKKIRFRIAEILDDYKHQPANKLVTSVLYCPSHVPSVFFDKTLEKFIKSPKLMHVGDVISVDLMIYGVEKLKDQIYFKVVNVEGPSNEHPSNVEHSYVVSQNTTVFGENFQSNYLPSQEWYLLDNNQLSSITPLLPFGLEKYYNSLIRWIQPFLSSTIHGLKPMFIISGVSGSGKTTIIEAVSKKFGLHCWNIDCFNIVSNTLSQISANIKTTLTNAAIKSPCILHLKNCQALSLESDGVDAVQMCESLRVQYENFTPAYPVIVIASCENTENLRREFVRLTLDQMHIDLPMEKERLLMVLWLSRVHSITMDQAVLEFLISETKTFPFARLRQLVCLAEKERLISKDIKLTCSHVTTVLGRMSSKERLSATVEWADVGGIELIKKEVVSSLISSRFLSTNSGAVGSKRTGLLLYGPPGTGKTLLARAVASQSMRSFVPVNGPDLLNMYVGQSEANVRAVFRRAREASPCIMFFDELDSIAPNRGNKSDSGGVMDRVVSTLLSEMDNLDSSGDVFILGATNRPDLLDPALLRPGRFDKMLYIGPCQDEDSKLKVLKALCRKFVLDDVLLEDIVKMLPSEVTGATVYAICSTAWLSAARELIRDGQVTSDTKVVVRMKHFQQAINETNR